MDNEGIPYRTGVSAMNPTPTRVVTADEENYNTLKAVMKMMQTAVDALYKDFNAFTLLKGATRTEARDHLVAQIEANQIAFGIVSPLLESIRDAIKVVDDKYKEQ
jgi:hypothetical protein